MEKALIEQNFDEDWKDYPRKAGNKRKAKACYLKTVNTPEKRNLFINKTKAYVASVNDHTYLQYGETWFRNWQDIEVSGGLRNIDKLASIKKIDKEWEGGNDPFKANLKQIGGGNAR